MSSRERWRFIYNLLAGGIAVFASISGICTAGNQLGIEVITVEEAAPLLKTLGSPPLGPRRCLIVSAVEEAGPCWKVLDIGFGLQRINGVAVADKESFADVVGSLQSGQDVVIEGVYVRPNGRGVAWASGKAAISLRPLKDNSDDAADPMDEVQGIKESNVAEDPPEFDGGVMKDEGHPESVQEPKGRDDEKHAAGDVGDLGEGADALPEGQDDGPDARDASPEAALSSPCVPLGLLIEGYPDYDKNDEAYHAVSYAAGPNGEAVYTLYTSEEFPDVGLVPATMEGFIRGQEGKKIEAMPPMERQRALYEALQEDRFCLHGRYAVWSVSAKVPTIGEYLLLQSGTDKSSSDEVVSRYKEIVRPLAFAYWYDGFAHGISRQWYPDGQLYETKRSLHGFPHMERETFTRKDGITEKETFLFGLAHGPLRSFHRNGQQCMEATNVRGKREGKEIQRFDDGKVRVRCEWKADKLDGKWEEFHPNGQKKSISFWKEGSLAKDEQCWDENGKAVPGRTMPLPPYEEGFKQGKMLGEQDFAFVSELEASGKQIDNPFALGRIAGRAQKFLADVLEAKRWAGSGGNPDILDQRQGMYDGYMKAVGRYGRR